MEKIFERIGLYDLWTVFFPGVIVNLELIVFMGTYWSLNRKCSIIDAVKKFIPDNVSEWIVIIFVSIFAGIVLQEIGRCLRLTIKCHNELDDLLRSDEGIFTKNELAHLRDFLIYCGWNGESIDDGRVVFHRINAEAQECGIAEKYVKLNVLHTMSLSLSAAVLLGSIASIIMLIMGITYGRYTIMLLMTSYGIICVILTKLFIRRSNRFYRYWVRNLVYAVSLKYREVEKRANGDTEEN